VTAREQSPATAREGGAGAAFRWTALTRRITDASPWLVDGLIGGLFALAFGTIRTVQVLEGVPDITPLHIVTAVLTGVALLFRRYRPLTVLAAVTLLVTVVTFSVDANNDLLAIPIALYAVAAYRSAKLAWAGGAGAIVVVVLGMLLHREELPERLAGSDVAYLLLVMAMTCIAAIVRGMVVTSRRQRLQALMDRADQLARERDSQATIATLAERGRIAREMHDVVAHSVSVMVALADGAASAIDRDPAASKRVLEELSTTGRAALDDMRRLLSVLGDGDGSLRPAPGQRDLEELAQRFRSAGLPVRLTISGAPMEDGTLALSVYRIVQESLTNALRYADSPTHVDAVVACEPDRVAVTVSDDGRGEPAESVGSARGLIGMQERAAVHGGTVQSGPGPNGGWTVRALLPREREEARADA